LIWTSLDMEPSCEFPKRKWFCALNISCILRGHSIRDDESEGIQDADTPARPRAGKISQDRWPFEAGHTAELDRPLDPG